MRSIFIHFLASDEDRIRRCLNAIATQRGPNEWRYPSEEATSVWCYLDDSFPDWDPDDLAVLRTGLPAPSKFIQADISGGIPGDTEVRELWRAVLSAVPGALVTDDYTNHPWTFEELESGHLVRGHCFFDYRGWYNETAG